MKRPDIKKPCETCCGTGEHMTDAGHFPCRVCHGEKEVPNYLTPEQWPYPMLDSDQIWIGFGEVGNYTWCAFPYDTARQIKESNPLIIARAGQPKPPEEWRPE